MAPLISSHESGVILLLQKHWTGSAALQAETILSGFTESFFRLRRDKEGTKPYLNQFFYPLVSDLESASEVCRRKLPEKSRNENYLYFVVRDLQAQDLRLHIKLPRWIHVQLLNRHKALFELSPSPSSFENWFTLDAAKEPEARGDWSEGILSFFEKPSTSELRMRLSSELKGLRHFRMSEFILRHQNPFLRTNYSICLE